MNWFIASLDRLGPEDVRFIRQAGDEGALPPRLALAIPEDEETWPYEIVARLYVLRYPRRVGSATIPQLMWRFNEENGSGIWEKRFVKMLDAGDQAPDQLYHELRSVVRFADQQTIGIDWSRLLADLVGIASDDPAKTLAREWAREFWTRPGALEPEDREMTIAEIIARYGLGMSYDRMLRRIAGTERLPARKSGKSWLIKRSDIDRWLREKPRPGRQPAVRDS